MDKAGTNSAGEKETGGGDFAGVQGV